ncbi:MAG TPA: hypothetical protein VK911_04155 [Vicinamibacterales bacterium]|nr:hypothetical protein [Vicinamibacterales bacterium]
MIALAAVLAAAASTLAALSIAPFWVALPLLAALAWYGLPGVLLARRWYGGGAGMAWLVGPLWGYALGHLVLLGLWALGWRHPSVAVVPPALVWLLVRFSGPRETALEAPRLGRRDVVAALLVVTLVPVLVGRPFSQVGQPVAEGVAYRAYFTADFVWARAVVAEVSKGEVPPQNMYLRGDALNYYWLPHLLTAVEHRAQPSAFTIDRVLLVNGLGLGLLFAAFLFGFIRHFTRGAVAAAVAAVFALAFVSLEGAYFLWRLWQTGGPLAAIFNTNVDGLTRVMFQSVIVDGLHRLLLYQVTHHGVGYVLGFSALLVAVTAREPGRGRAAGLAGLLLGMGFLFSSFASLILGVAVGAWYGARLLARGEWRRIPVVGLVGLVPVMAAVGISLGLQYADGTTELVQLGLNRTAARNAAKVLPLSFGVLLPAGLIGAVVALWGRRWESGALALTALIAFVFYFYVNVRDHMDVYVAWRAGHILIMVLAALGAVAWESGWERGRGARAGLVAAAVLAAFATVPTTFFDIYNSQDVWNRQPGPGFRWTVILTPEEAEGLAWIRERTREQAVVQVEPWVRGRDTWAYITAFGERRMAAGLPISMVPLRKYEEASERIRQIYQAASPDEVFARCARERIDYLVVGEPERRAYPAFEQVLDSRPDLFVPVFRNGGVAVWRLRGARP